MSFTLGNGWDQDFGYFSLRGPRAIGHRLHSACKKARAYDLPEGFLPGSWRKWHGLRSVKRGSYRPSVLEARNRLFYRAMNRNPLYYARIGDRPAGALRLGYAFDSLRRAASERRKKEQRLYSEETRSVAVTLHGFTWNEIESLLANSEGPAMPENPEERTLEWLVTTVLAHWADGWSRPGSWERSMLDMMGHAND